VIAVGGAADDDILYDRTVTTREQIADASACSALLMNYIQQLAGHRVGAAQRLKTL
jgi:hypothetical protein